MVDKVGRRIGAADRCQQFIEAVEIGDAVSDVGVFRDQAAERVAFCQRQGIIDGAMHQRLDFWAQHHCISLPCSFQPSSISPSSWRAL